jgi:hypothetical protein
MRRIVLVIVAMLVSVVALSQIHVSVNVNLDRQPIWGPTGYDHVEYYYFPDIDVFYNVPLGRFYYYENNRWTHGKSLPNRARGFDLYHAYKVVVNEPTPYRKGAIYREKYASLKGRHDQQLIRDSRDTRYFANPNHPEHGNWVKQQKHEESNKQGNGHSRNHKNKR